MNSVMAVNCTAVISLFVRWENYSITVLLPDFVTMQFSTLLLQVMQFSISEFFDFSFQVFLECTAIHLTFQIFQQCTAIHLTFQILQFNSFYFSAFLAMPSCFSFSCHFVCFHPFKKFLMVCMFTLYSILIFELCSNPLI